VEEETIANDNKDEGGRGVEESSVSQLTNLTSSIGIWKGVC
jgi:hypothetical protein